MAAQTTHLVSKTQPCEFDAILRELGWEMVPRLARYVTRSPGDVVSATLRIRDVATDCGHLLCELIDRPCSLATGRSRGCRPNLGSKIVAPEVIDEVRQLLAVIDPTVRDERSRTAAIRLAEIMRREALDDRPLLAYARIEEPELASALTRLCVRQR